MVSVKPWKFDALLRVLAIFFICLFTLGLLQEFVLPKDDESHLFQILGLLCMQVVTLVLAGLLLREHNTTWSEAFGFGSPGTGRVLLIGLAVGCAALPAIMLLHAGSVELMEMLRLDPEAQEAVTMIQEARTVGELALLGFVTMITAPVAEEILFRGLIYPTIKQAGYPRIALWSTSVGFALVHGNLAALMPLTVLAIVFVILYERTNNLLAPIIVHALFNAGNFVLMLLINQIASETGFIG